VIKLLLFDFGFLLMLLFQLPVTLWPDISCNFSRASKSTLLASLVMDAFSRPGAVRGYRVAQLVEGFFSSALFVRNDFTLSLCRFRGFWLSCLRLLCILLMDDLQCSLSPTQLLEPFKSRLHCEKEPKPRASFCIVIILSSCAAFLNMLDPE
jgi:hypothetical protein